jgi:K+-transporting ATPase ATPase A chain
MAVMIGMIRGFSRRNSPTIGNFWVDITRGVYYILLPIAAVAAVIYIGQGAVQTLAGPAHIHDVLNNVSQIIPRGPQGSMTSIKQLGNNGGGYTNANGAHPFENPTAFTQWLSLYLLLLIPVSSTYMYGKMIKSIRQGVAVLATMAVLFVSWAAFSQYAEAHGNPAVARAGVTAQASGNMEGKETRFGVAETTLFDIASTQTSTGSVTGSNDSFTPIGGMGLLTGMMLGEVSPGGAGAGMYTILAFAIIAVFIGGLMVGRTPEYLGKKIQSREVKLAATLVLVMPMLVLIMTGIAVSIHAGRAGPENGGPHGFTEILYGFTSPVNNNGSAFAGLTANTPFYNVMQSGAFWFGRFAEMVPALALGGVLAQKNVVAESAGTFRTDTPLFVGLFVGVILIVGALTFFPAVALGPIVEQLQSHKIYPAPSGLGPVAHHVASNLRFLIGPKGSMS